MLTTQETTQEKAREILGKDFSPIEDALRLFPALNHPKKYRIKMAAVPFSEDFLKSRKGSLIICPGFNRLGDDIFSLQTLGSMFFERAKPHISYHNKHFNTAALPPEHQFWSGNEKFFSDDTAQLRWYAISKTPKAPQRHISIFEQDAIMEPDRMRENAFVYTWVAWLHFLRTGELLWPKVSAWTSDVLSDGRRVAVGGWEDSEKPIWVLEPSDSSISRFPKTVPSYEPNMF